MACQPVNRAATPDRAKSFLQRLHRGDRGTVAVTFLMSLPVLLSVIAIFVQYALIIEARLTVQRAAAAAARSAMTSLPTDPAIDPTDAMGNVARAACLVIEPLSPQSPQTNASADTLADALTNSGWTLPYAFVARYSYAAQATNIAYVINNVPYTSDDSAQSWRFAQQANANGQITVSYQFQLTVPFAAQVIGYAGNVAGVSGRFLSLQSTVDVQLSPGREARSDSGGNPL